MGPLNPAHPSTLHIGRSYEVHQWQLWQQDTQGKKNLPVALNHGKAFSYTPFEKGMLAAYERLLSTGPLLQEREFKYVHPLPI